MTKLEKRIEELEEEVYIYNKALLEACNHIRDIGNSLRTIKKNMCGKGEESPKYWLDLVQK